MRRWEKKQFSDKKKMISLWGKKINFIIYFLSKRRSCIRLSTHLLKPLCNAMQPSCFFYLFIIIMINYKVGFYFLHYILIWFLTFQLYHFDLQYFQCHVNLIHVFIISMEKYDVSNGIIIKNIFHTTSTAHCMATLD